VATAAVVVVMQGQKRIMLVLGILASAVLMAADLAVWDMVRPILPMLEQVETVLFVLFGAQVVVTQVQM
jgi:hypothetical protein